MLSRSRGLLQGTGAKAKTFGAHSTTDEVLAGVDLSGKRVLVTGVSAGLGVETARVLAARGAVVVGAARDLTKARRATEIVHQDAKRGGDLQLVELDLASLKSVRACADKLVAAGDKFDLVIANGGVMATPKGKTVDGLSWRGERKRRWKAALPRYSACLGLSGQARERLPRKLSLASPTQTPGSGVNQSSRRSH